jgi:hypothetical protein
MLNLLNYGFLTKNIFAAKMLIYFSHGSKIRRSRQSWQQDIFRLDVKKVFSVIRDVYSNYKECTVKLAA